MVLERKYLCSFRQRVNCYKLRIFILLSMSGCLRKQIIYFNSFYGLKLVDFEPVWCLFPIHKAGVPLLPL